MTETDQPLITALLSIAEKLREGKYTCEEKEELLDVITPYASDDSEVYIDINLKVAWKYLTYGWAVSPLLDAIGISLEKIASTGTATPVLAPVLTTPVQFEFAPAPTK